MGAISSAINWFIGLGPIVIVTVMLFVVGVAFGAPWRKALVGGLLVGVGLQGLFLVVNLIVENMEPALTALASRFGWTSTIVDVGWGTAGLAFGWPGLAAVYIGILAVNFVLVALRVQKTLWTDIWGMWHSQTFGACIWALTDNVVIAIVAAVIYSTIAIWFADYQKKEFQKFLQIPGISFPAGPSAHFTAVAIPVLAVLEKIPFIKDLEADVDAIRDRFGVLGEPVVMGAVVGLIVGLVAGYPPAKFIGLATVVAAMMVLLPRMVAILSEGLVPVTTEIVDFLRRRFTKGDKKYDYGEEPVSVSVDVAVQVGPPSVIAASVIAMPLMVLLGAILPGNQLLAITSLASVPYYLGALMPWAKGNVAKAILALLIVAIPYFYISTYMAPVYTAAFAKLGLYAEQIAAGKQVAAFGLGGGDWMALIWVTLFRLIGLAKF